MRNLILSAIGALSAGALFLSVPATPAKAAVSANIDIHIGDPYPNAYFVREPRAVLIPATRVYYVDDMGYDLYRCDNYWYIDDGGYWYRAPSYRGPFLGISFSSVPRQILNVPVAYRHQPYRPVVTQRYDNNRWRYENRTYDRSWSDNHSSGRRTSDRNWSGRRTSDRDHNSQWSAGQRRSVLNTDLSRNWENGKNKSKGNGNGKGNGHSHGRGNGRGNGNK